MEWKTVKLGDVCEIFGRIGFRGYTIEDFVEKPSDGAITLSPTNIVDGAIDLTNCKYVNWKKYEESPEIMIQKGDIVIVKTGSSVGRTAYFREVPHPITINPQFVVLKKINIDSLYLAYYVKSVEFQGNLQSIVVGSAIPTLSQKNLAKLPIPLPSIETQHRIAAILSSLDDKIENNNRINANLEAQAQSLYKSWFVDFEPWGGVMPEDWKEGKLEDLATKIASGGTPSSMNKEYYLGDIKWFSTKELADSFLLDSEKHISYEAYNNSAAKLFPAGTVLMAIYAAPTVGRLGILTEEATFNQAAVGIIPKEEVGCEYLFLLLKDERVRLNNLASGAAQQNLNVRIVKNYPIVIPTIRVSIDFQQKVKPLFDQIANNQKESQRLAQVRDTLLPKLMRGEIEL